jgi:hypothetical protein
VGCAGSLTAVLRATRCHRRRCAALVVSDPGGTAFELLGGASATASLDPEGQAPRWLRTYAKDAPRLIVRATADRGPTQTAPAQVRRALFRIS